MYLLFEIFGTLYGTCRVLSQPMPSSLLQTLLAFLPYSSKVLY